MTDRRHLRDGRRSLRGGTGQQRWWPLAVWHLVARTPPGQKQVEGARRVSTREM